MITTTLHVRWIVGSILLGCGIALIEPIQGNPTTFSSLQDLSIPMNQHVWKKNTYAPTSHIYFRRLSWPEVKN